MVGANQGFSREILQKVPAFDPELGAGALGLGEDHLFASQLLEAGVAIVGGLDVCVEHHLSPLRLKREAWIGSAVRLGKSHAYRGYHWEHWRSRFTWMKWLRARIELAGYRANPRHTRAPEGCSERELNLVFGCSLFRALIREQKRPRCYQRRGLVKLAPIISSTSSPPNAQQHSNGAVILDSTPVNH